MKEWHSLEKHETIARIKSVENDVFSKMFSFATKYSYGMHLSEDCINMSIQDYISLLSKMGYTKFILLYRKNYLKRVISILQGRFSGQWHTKNDVNIPFKSQT